jgi:Ferritin-like domain
MIRSRNDISRDDVSCDDISRDDARRARHAADALHRNAMGSMRDLLDGAPAALIGGFARRRFLTIGGLSVSMAAVVAACGKAEPTPTVPVAGESPSTSGLPERVTDDVVLLRTASSLEHNAIDTYGVALGLGVLSPGATELAKMFQDHHREHADAFEKATIAAGGKAFTEANPVVAAKILGPAVALIGKSEDKPGDLLRLAHALESVAAGTYQALVPALSQPGLRKAAMAVGGVEARHAAVLAKALGAALFQDKAAEASTTTAKGAKPTVTLYQVPGAFGLLSAVPVMLNGEAQVSIDLPGPNSFMYP